VCFWSEDPTAGHCLEECSGAISGRRSDPQGTAAECRRRRSRIRQDRLRSERIWIGKASPQKSSKIPGIPSKYLKLL
jgi:hypothetical protein